MFVGAKYDITKNKSNATCKLHAVEIDEFRFKVPYAQKKRVHAKLAKKI